MSFALKPSIDSKLVYVSVSILILIGLTSDMIKKVLTCTTDIPIYAGQPKKIISPKAYLADPILINENILPHKAIDKSLEKTKIEYKCQTGSIAISANTVDVDKEIIQRLGENYNALKIVAHDNLLLFVPVKDVDIKLSSSVQNSHNGVDGQNDVFIITQNPIYAKNNIFFVEAVTRIEGVNLDFNSVKFDPKRPYHTSDISKEVELTPISNFIPGNKDVISLESLTNRNYSGIRLSAGDREIDFFNKEFPFVKLHKNDEVYDIESPNRGGYSQLHDVNMAGYFK